MTASYTEKKTVTWLVFQWMNQISLKSYKTQYITSWCIQIQQPGNKNHFFSQTGISEPEHATLLIRPLLCNKNTAAQKLCQSEKYFGTRCYHGSLKERLIYLLLASPTKGKTRKSTEPGMKKGTRNSELK